jgi:SAM-dependent methyltransferase
MSTPDSSTVYQYPRYYAIGYQWNTKPECDFLEACMGRFGPPGMSQKVASDRSGLRMLDIGCGAGRHLLELTRRGYEATGCDLRPEMVDYVREQAREEGLRRVHVSVGNLRELALQGTYDVAFCLMDTFRFLLTNDEILRHLRHVAEHLSPGGLYVTDFWVPMRWDQAANEIYQWEQIEGDTTVRVFYVQHPDSVDPVAQTFEDELVFDVKDGAASKEIRGGRTKTRLIMPQEFRALVAASRVFDVIGTFSEFDADKPLEAASGTWRMVTVLKTSA